MLDLGWSELAIVGGIILIVVGPKDLPKVLRTFGIWMGKARKMAREFQKALDDYAREADVDDIRKAVETPMKAKKAVTNAIDPKGALKNSLKEADKDVRENLKEVDQVVKGTPVTTADNADPTTPGKPKAVAAAEKPTSSAPKVQAGTAS
ncbi:MAG: twin-arginine translocase subunit TatB [Rhodospirillales bacterium]|nr:twin-arginine translocase subunit TatB [Rhodospirillales bacterium]